MFRGMLLSVGLLLAPSAAAGAGEYFEVTKDTLLFSEPGTLVRITDPGVEGLTYHAFEAGAWVRLYAAREDGTDDWVVAPIPVFLCPVFQMSPGLGWKFPDDEAGNARFAQAIQAEPVTVAAGTFPNAWRVEVTRDDQPSVVQLTIWFVANEGIVKQVEWVAGVPVRKSELQDSDVTGLGFFPLLVGNWWQYSDIAVQAESASVGSLKGRFVR